VQKKPQPLTELRPDLPEGFMPVLERMMAKNRKRRYETPAEVAIALEPFTFAPAARDDGRTAVLDNTSVRRRRQRRFLIATAILAFLVAGLLGVGVYRIATDNGELVIETDNDDVEVVVSKGGKVVKIIDTKSGKHVTLNSGEYELALKDGREGLRLSPVKMAVNRGEIVLATITRETKAEDGKVILWHKQGLKDSGLIKNGCFEAGLKGWGNFSHGPPTRFEIDQEVAREGRQSLRVTAPEPANNGCFQVVHLKPGRWYHFTGWVRTRGLKLYGEADGQATITIGRVNGPGRPDWQALVKGPNHTGDTEWTQVSLRFQAPDEGSVCIFLGPCWGPGHLRRVMVTGTAWFDGLKVVEVSQPAQ
jgi:hypothetical protein